MQLQDTTGKEKPFGDGFRCAQWTLLMHRIKSLCQLRMLCWACRLSRKKEQDARLSGQSRGWAAEEDRWGTPVEHAYPTTGRGQAERRRTNHLLIGSTADVSNTSSQAAEEGEKMLKYTAHCTPPSHEVLIPIRHCCTPRQRSRRTWHHGNFTQESSQCHKQLTSPVVNLTY